MKAFSKTNSSRDRELAKFYPTSKDEIVVGVKVFESETLKTIEDNSKMPMSKIIGKTYKLDALESEEVWQIERIIYSSNTTYQDFANDGLFTSSFTNRYSLFDYKSISSLSFNGVDEYVEVAPSAEMIISNESEYWLSVWIKPNDLNGLQRIVTNRNDSNAKLPCAIDLFLNNDKVGFYTGDTSKKIWVEGVETINVNEWSHLVIYYDGSLLASGVSIFLNGVTLSKTVLFDTAAAEGDVSSNWYFGKNLTLGYFSGKMDEMTFKINEEMTPAIAQAIYNNGKPTDMTLYNVDHWWTFGEGDTFPYIEDKIQNTAGIMTNMLNSNFSQDTPSYA